MANKSNMPEFSVIIPVYNVEQYLGRCILSVLNQTFTDFELILIDDGSPDRSGIICDKFASEDKRIIVIHQKNCGVSAARNAGLDIARGKYVVFIDSDDTVDANYLECMCGYDSDMVITGINDCYVNVGNRDRILISQNKKIKISEDFVCQMISGHLIDYVFSKRYLRKLIQKKRLRFNEKINLGEDTLFVSQYLCSCDWVQLVSDTSYVYHQYEQKTLSGFDKNYIDKLITANQLILGSLQLQFPLISDTTAWKKRCWSIFYYSIFFVLREYNASKSLKRVLLAQYFSMPEYRSYCCSLDDYMQDDPKIWRVLLRTHNADIVMLGWKISQFISKLKGKAR